VTGMYESSTIRLVFSEPLDPRTVALAKNAFSLTETASGASVPAALIAGGIHVAIDPSDDLVAGRSYTLAVGNLVADLGGQPVAPVAITFTPVELGDDPIRQRLRTRQPTDRGRPMPAGAVRNLIAIDEPLIGKQTSQIQLSVLEAELGDPALGGPMAFTIRRGQRMRATGLDVRLGGELALGLSTGDIVIELLTDGNGQITRNRYQPETQRPDNDRSPLAVELGLDLAIYAVNAAGNAVLTQTVLGVQGSGTVVATDGVLDIEAVIAIELDLLGIATAPANLVLQLITDPPATPSRDFVVPALVASLPAAGGELAVDASIELIFSEPIDLETASGRAVRLETDAGVVVPAIVEGHGSVVVIRPVDPLAYSTTYRVVSNNVEDLAGNQNTSIPELVFSTPPLVGTTVPLTVAAVHPGAPCALTAGAMGSGGQCSGGEPSDDSYRPFALPANEPIEVRFTQPPAAASIVHGTACNTGSVRIEEIDGAGACVAAVAGTFTHRDRRVSFVPHTPWRMGTRYRLILHSGTNTVCENGDICGLSGVVANFDPLAGNTAAGGPDLAINFVGAPASEATFLITETTPITDVNGSGEVEVGERVTAENRVALRIASTGGIVTGARFKTPDCLDASPEPEACMYLSGAMPVELLPPARNCRLLGGEIAATCVPVVLSPQAVFATSVSMEATAMIGNSRVTVDPIDMHRLVMRIREPAGGPVTGYLIDVEGKPTLVVTLEVYLDAVDLSMPFLDHDVKSKTVAVSLRGPLTFLPDGRIAIEVTSVADVALVVNVSGDDRGQTVNGSLNLVIPTGEMRLRLVSAPLRGGLR
jgi:hypothetical protein